MNALIGVYACVAIERAVKSSLNPNVIWKEKESDQVQSTVGCPQLYSDKSQTLMSADLYFFYPLHITLLNFKENTSQKTIVLCSSIVAYLPVCYSDGEMEFKKKRKRVLKIAGPHNCIDYAMSRLSERGM